MNLARRSLLAVAVLGLFASCGGQPDPSKMPTSAPTEVFEFTNVVDKTRSKYYRVKGTARGETTHMYGTTSSEITIYFEILNANGTTFSPQVEIRWADGTTMKCVDRDPRRQPSLNDWTTSWYRPCQGLFQDPTGAVVTVRDAYG